MSAPEQPPSHHDGPLAREEGRTGPGSSAVVCQKQGLRLPLRER
jgi:hypothetical protein